MRWKGNCMPTLYGLKACDTCRNAQKAVEAAGYDITFHDVRETPLSEAKLAKYLEMFGDALVNKRSTTWRTLSESDREKPALELLGTHPTLMKRPIIEGETGATLGWAKDVQSNYLG